jgi:hypothetical protein
MRDTQKKKVYDWEDAVAVRFSEYNTGLSKKDVHQLIGWVIVDYGLSIVPNLRVKYEYTAPRRGHADCALESDIQSSIVLVNPTVTVTLHELAHVAQMQLAQRASDPATYPLHGPEFVGLYIDLLVSYGEFPERPLRQLADKMRVKYNFTHVKPSHHRHLHENLSQ